MHTTINPPNLAPPLARYSHGVEVRAQLRWVFCSGQLGMDVSGHVPADTEGQADLCFANIRAILAEAGMEMGDIVRINAYVCGREHLAAYMRSRDRHVSAPLPASTLMIVSGFARPEFTVEIEAIAARE